MSEILLQALKPGQVLSERYEVLKRIGEGGMGSVYLGTQLALGQKVAIKTLHPELTRSPGVVARFKREALLAKKLSHPNTIRIYDFGMTESGVLYLVLEYLDGRTLDAVLQREGPFTNERIIDIGKQVLKSLIEAHACDVIHRDIKPSNLMLCNQIGEPNFVKVLDFGLARADCDASTFQTLSGSVMGTPHYMSPEQVRGRRVDGRSDLYSLGLTLLELATGLPPYTGSSAYEVALQHLEPEPILIPHALRRTQLGNVIAKAAEKELSKRYASARDMYQELTGEVLEEMPIDVAAEVNLSVPPTMPSPLHGFPPPDSMAFSRTVESGPAPEPNVPLSTDSPVVKTPRSAWTVTASWMLGALSAGAVILLIRGFGADSEPADDSANTEVVTATPSEIEPVPGEIAVVPASIRFSIISQPSNATVFLDGVAVCITECDAQLPVGSPATQMRVELHGYVSDERLVDLTGSVVLPIILEPVPDVETEAEAEVEPEPPNRQERTSTSSRERRARDRERRVARERGAEESRPEPILQPEAIPEVEEEEEEPPRRAVPTEI